MPRANYDFGAYVDNEPWPDLTTHYALEQAVGGQLNPMSWFQSWDTPWLTGQASTAAKSGHDLVVCWEPMRGGAAVRFADILAGTYDPYLRQYFTSAASFPRPVSIRLFHEMNGRWYPWSLAHPAPAVASAEDWIATWRYIVTLQRSISGDRVRWVWCPNNWDVGGVPAETYYPGSGYVDTLGLDGYNGYGSWDSPYEVIAPMYSRLAALHPVAPIIVGEIGCREAELDEPQSKASWLQALFTETRFPRLTLVNFFSASKEHDWRLDSSPASLDMARRYLRRG